MKCGVTVKPKMRLKLKMSSHTFFRAPISHDHIYKRNGNVNTLENNHVKEVPGTHLNAQ